MTTVLESLKGVNAYPVPQRAIVDILQRNGLMPEDELTSEMQRGKAYNISVADVLLWLSLAPNVAQGGINYSFSDAQRTVLRNRAYSIYKDFGADSEAGKPKPIYGYKGARL